jgi:hypothetical protein
VLDQALLQLHLQLELLVVLTQVELILLPQEQQLLTKLLVAAAVVAVVKVVAENHKPL